MKCMETRDHSVHRPSLLHTICVTHQQLEFCICSCNLFIWCTCLLFVGFNGPSYKRLGGLSGCLLQTDSLCFNKVLLRVRRNASVNMEVATVPSASRPLFSSTTNMSLESTLDQSNVSSRHNDSLHWPANELLPNSTLLPAKVTDNMTDVLDILEASTFLQCCGVVCNLVTVALLCQSLLALFNTFIALSLDAEFGFSQ